MSFDPHPIDRLALSCLLIEGVALLNLPSPPAFLRAGEQVQALGTGRERANPVLLQHTPQVGSSLGALLRKDQVQHLCTSSGTTAVGK